MISVIIRAIIVIIINRKILMIIGLKGDHEEGCPWFLIFPTAEETSHVDGAAVLLQYCSTPCYRTFYQELRGRTVG